MADRLVGVSAQVLVSIGSGDIGFPHPKDTRTMAKSLVLVPSRGANSEFPTPKDNRTSARSAACQAASGYLDIRNPLADLAD